MKSQDLKGKCAIVTGASRGIGRAIAQALAREGVGVVICARGQSEGDKADPLASLAEAIRGSGGRALAVRADVSREEDAQSLVERAWEEFGRLDVLVNNAAVFPLYHTPLVLLR